MQSSESYIKEKIRKRIEKDQEKGTSSYSVSPSIPQNKLVNAVNKIAPGVDTGSIIALYDDSLMSNGKEGIVFTGSKIYMHQMLCGRIEIPLENIKNCVYESKDTVDSNGNIKTYVKMTVNYNDDTSVIVTSDEFTKELDFVSDLLKNINSSVDSIEVNSQQMTLSELGDDIIENYFDIVIGYLKSDDGIIDSKEYKELLSLMAKFKF